MNLIDRYIARTVLTGSLLAFVVLLSLAAFFAFIDQLGDLRSDYTALKALEHVMYLMPRRGYELFHTAILLGSLLSLGALASHSELIVLRAAGMSIGKITWSVMKAGLILMLFGILIGEVIAPPAEQHAQKLRAAAIAGSTSIHSDKGFWSKSKQSFIQIGRVFPDKRLADIRVFTFDKHHLKKMIRAQHAVYNGESWTLKQADVTDFSTRQFSRKLHEELDWHDLVQPEMLETLSVKAQNLSMWSLYKYIRHLDDTEQDFTQYELAFWMKVAKPLSVLIMLLIAMPFVFGSLRTSSVGQRLLVGVLLGLGFHMFNQALNHVGVGYGLNPIVSAFLPSLLFTVGGVWALRKIH